jgi:hypothetical protein
VIFDAYSLSCCGDLTSMPCSIRNRRQLPWKMNRDCPDSPLPKDCSLQFTEWLFACWYYNRPPVISLTNVTHDICSGLPASGTYAGLTINISNHIKQLVRRWW